jgi:crotonobetainyl-CoA:carnitine CoA-transferase CaiB-like acyl-CoA transferase
VTAPHERAAADTTTTKRSRDMDAAQSEGPLTGVRVIEVGGWHAGPGAGAILGDLGADVVKIEPPGGDPERHFGTFGPMAGTDDALPDWTSLFEFSNRNKRGICLDLATPEGRGVLDRLVAQADVLVTNLRTGSLPKLGLDYDALARTNPRIIQVAVSGFGSRGPLRNHGGFDPMGQAISGMAFLGSDEPTVLQMIVLDQLTSITAAFGAITALYTRATTGRGQSVETSLYGAATWLTARNLQVAGFLGRDVGTRWTRTANSPLRTSFRCRDDKWIIGTNHPEEKYWSSFCTAVGLPGLEHDPRFLTRESRAEHSTELFEVLDAVFASRDQAEWIPVMAEHGVLFAPVQRSVDVLDDQQAIENGYVVDFDHEDLGRVRMHGFPIAFGAGRAGPQSRAPRLGEHTAEVLREVGYDDAEISSLVATGGAR